MKRTSSFYAIKAVEGRKVRYKIVSRTPQRLSVVSFIKGGTTTFYRIKTTTKQIKHYRLTMSEPFIQRYAVSARILRGNSARYVLRIKKNKHIRYKVISKDATKQRYMLTAPVLRGSYLSYSLNTERKRIKRYKVISGSKIKRYPIIAQVVLANELHYPIVSTQKQIVSYPIVAKTKTTIRYPIISTTYEDAVKIDVECDAAELIRKHQTNIAVLDLNVRDKEKYTTITKINRTILLNDRKIEILDFDKTIGLGMHAKIDGVNHTINNHNKITMINESDYASVGSAKKTSTSMKRDSYNAQELKTIRDDFEITSLTNRLVSVSGSLEKTLVQNVDKVKLCTIDYAEKDVNYGANQLILNAAQMINTKHSNIREIDLLQVQNIYKTKQYELVSGALLRGDTMITKFGASLISNSFKTSKYDFVKMTAQQASKTAIETIVSSVGDNNYTTQMSCHQSVDSSQKMDTEITLHDVLTQSNNSKTTVDTFDALSQRTTLKTSVNSHDVSVQINKRQVNIKEIEKATMKAKEFSAKVKTLENCVYERELRTTTNNHQKGTIERKIRITVEQKEKGVIKKRLHSRKTDLVAGSIDRKTKTQSSNIERSNSEQVKCTQLELINITSLEKELRVKIDDFNAGALLAGETNIENLLITSVDRTKQTQITNVDTASRKDEQCIRVEDFNISAMINQHNIHIVDKDIAQAENTHRTSVSSKSEGIIERVLKTSVIDKNEGCIERVFSTNIADFDRAIRLNQVHAFVKGIDAMMRDTTYKMQISDFDTILQRNDYKVLLSDFEIIARLENKYPTTIFEPGIGTANEREKQDIWLHMGKSSWLQGWKHWKSR